MGDCRHIVAIDALHDRAPLLIYRRRIPGAEYSACHRGHGIAVAADVRSHEDGVLRRLQERSEPQCQRDNRERAVRKAARRHVVRPKNRQRRKVAMDGADSGREQRNRPALPPALGFCCRSFGERRHLLGRGPVDRSETAAAVAAAAAMANGPACVEIEASRASFTSLSSESDEWRMPTERRVQRPHSHHAPPQCAWGRRPGGIPTVT